MATAVQIQAETWWQREIVTTELDWLGDELCRRTGRPRDAAGSKGNTAHLNGAHRSQEWLLNSIYCTNRTYTVQSGLTGEQPRHIAGFDFTPGNVTDMIAQSRRLIAAMQAGLLDEVLAAYCNIDGDQVVDGWDNVRDRAATSDSSHLWHWHLTLDRRHLKNKALMERIVATVMGDDMSERASRIIEAYAVGLERTSLGETVAMTTWRIRDEAWQAKVTASLAADATRDAAVLAAVKALATAGGVDAAPIVSEIRAARAETLGAVTALQQQLAETERERDELAARLAAALTQE